MDYSKYYINEFKKFISIRTSSNNTIKNYLSDLRVFFNFVNQQLSLSVTAETMPALLSEPSLVKYDEYLSSTNPPATAKRRTSSLKKFVEFCATQNIISPAPVIQPPPPVSPPPSYQPPPSVIPPAPQSQYPPVAPPPFVAPPVSVPPPPPPITPSPPVAPSPPTTAPVLPPSVSVSFAHPPPGYCPFRSHPLGHRHKYTARNTPPA